MFIWYEIFGNWEILFKLDFTISFSQIHVTIFIESLEKISIPIQIF